MPAMTSRMTCPGSKVVTSRVCSRSSLEFQYTWEVMRSMESIAVAGMHEF